VFGLIIAVFAVSLWTVLILNAFLYHDKIIQWCRERMGIKRISNCHWIKEDGKYLLDVYDMERCDKAAFTIYCMIFLPIISISISALSYYVLFKLLP